MVKLVKGKDVVETDLPVEVTQLKAHGYRVQDEKPASKSENKK